MRNASTWEDPPGAGAGAGQRQAPGAGQQAQSGWQAQSGQQTPPGQPDPGIPPQRVYQAEAGGRELAGPQHHGFAHGLARGPFSGFIPWI